MSADWPEFQLGSRCRVKSSKRIFAHEYVENGIPFMRSKDVIDKALGSFVDYEFYISEERFKGIKKTHGSPRKGDLLMSSVGNRSGQPYVIKDEGDFHFKDGNILWLSEFQDINSDYLAYWLKSEIGQGALISIMIGSVQKALTIDSVRKLWVRLPSIEYQNKAVEVLMKLDEKTELNRQTNQTLEQMAQAIFKSWFVDFEPVKAKITALEAGGSEDDALLAAMQAIAGSALFAADVADADAPTQLARLQSEHPEQYTTLRATAELFPSAMQESELGEIPEGWRASTLSDFCEFQNGYAFKGKDWADSGFPVVKIGSVKPGFVDLTKVSYVSSETVAGLERFELKAGDILVGMTGYPGETGLVPNYADRVFLNQRVGRFIPNEKYLYAYIFSAVRGSEFKVFVESQAHGSAQANISGKAILQYPLISGSKNLMMRFYEVVNPQIQQMICLNAESSQLGELRDTLLPKLLSGEITLAEEVKRS